MSKITDEEMEMMIENSFKNFHVKGFDYLCIHRSEQLTIKVYMMDGDASKMTEVVNPHDHRYLFTTTVLAGEMIDHRYELSDDGDLYNAFDYLTPLNGGNGFTFRGEERLKKTDSLILDENQDLMTLHFDLHTIGFKSDQTVIMLNQFRDTVPIDVPTSCWSPVGSPEPNNNNSGLYEKFTADEIIAKLVTIEGLMP